MNDHSQPIPRDRVPVEIQRMAQESVNCLRVIRAALALPWSGTRRVEWHHAVLEALDRAEDALLRIQDTVLGDVTLMDLHRAADRLEADADLLDLKTEHGSPLDPPNDDIDGTGLLRGAADLLENEAEQVRQIAREIEGAVKGDAA